MRSRTSAANMFSLPFLAHISSSQTHDPLANGYGKLACLRGDVRDPGRRVQRSLERRIRGSRLRVTNPIRVEIGRVLFVST